MTHSWRISALAERHRALGSNLEDWNGMGTAWTYDSDLADHHQAIRTRAGLMDVSGLKKSTTSAPTPKPAAMGHHPRHRQALPRQVGVRLDARRGRQVRR
jgi:glycine cleavage system aminomethyltransferase T